MHKNDSSIQKIKELDTVLDTTHRLFQSFFINSSQYPLSLAQMLLLKILNEKGTCSPSGIAQMMGITSGAVTSLTDRLISQELIQRERSELDRRVVMISLTPRGSKLADGIEQERMEKMVEIFSSLPEEDIEALIRIYKKLADNLLRMTK